MTRDEDALRRLIATANAADIAELLCVAPSLGDDAERVFRLVDEAATCGVTPRSDGARGRSAVAAR